MNRTLGLVVGAVSLVVVSDAVAQVPQPKVPPPVIRPEGRALLLRVTPPSRVLSGTCETMTSIAAPAPSNVQLAGAVLGVPNAPPVTYSVYRMESANTEAGNVPSSGAWRPQSAGQYRLRAAAEISTPSPQRLTKEIANYVVPLTVALDAQPAGGERQVSLKAGGQGTPAGATNKFAFCAKPLDGGGQSQWRSYGDANDAQPWWIVTVPRLGPYRFYVMVFSVAGGNIIASGEQVVPTYDVRH